MKTEANSKLWPRNRASLCATSLRVAVASTLILGLMPRAALAQINGTTSGSTVSGVVGDDTITSTTINMGFFTSCYFITQGVTNQGFGGYNFVFAGQGVASAIQPISSSDFTISQYAPWIGNNNGGANTILGPDGYNWSRSDTTAGGVTNQETGGANILISYTPKAGDPTSINFLQAYVLSENNGPQQVGTIDNGGSGGPFYNQGGISGVGTNQMVGTIPFNTSSNTPGWMIDIPFTPEWGYTKPGADDTITNETDTFQTFISSQQTINGTNYNVLYGGVQWGYSFSAVDVVPEPGGIALVAAGLLGMALWQRHMRRQA